MPSAVARFLRRLSCHLDGHRPLYADPVLAPCRSCGAILVGGKEVSERARTAVNRAWRSRYG